MKQYLREETERMTEGLQGDRWKEEKGESKMRKKRRGKSTMEGVHDLPVSL